MKSMIKARINKELKIAAESILKEQGLSASLAIRTLYIFIIEHGKLPFDIYVPNEETLEAFRDIKEGRTFKVKSIETLRQELLEQAKEIDDD